MATIKDVAKMAGVSTTTVSYIIGGTAGKHKISVQTQEHVLQIMRELQYIPRASTKKSLPNYPNEYTIAIYMAREFKNFFMHRILDGINEISQDSNKQCRIILCTYACGKLCKESDLRTAGRYHGAIVISANADDILYLESQTFLIPIILFNRGSAKFSSVVSNDDVLKEYMKQLLLKHRAKSTGIITINDYTGFSGRTALFEKACHEIGIDQEPFQLSCNNFSVCEGQKAAKIMIQEKQLPDLLFCATEHLAVGVNSILKPHNSATQHQCSYFAVSVGEYDILDVLLPELTYIMLPLRELGKEAMKLLLGSISNPYSIPCVVSLNPLFHSGTTA